MATCRQVSAITNVLVLFVVVSIRFHTLGMDVAGGLYYSS